MFNPQDPAIFKNGFTHYNTHDSSRDDYEEFGFNRRKMIGILLLKKLRATTNVKKLSLFMTIEGRHRSGKSRGWALFSCLFSKTFEHNMKKFIVSDADQLLELVGYIEREKILYPIIIVDEAGAALNSGDWFEKMQKAIVKTMTVIGLLLPTIIFIAPIKDLILSGIRKMSHYHVSVSRWNDKFAKMDFYEVHYNSLRGKPYFKKPKINYLGIPIKIKSLIVKLPPKSIDNQYSEIEKERKPIMLKDIRDDAMRSRIKQEREVVDFDRIADLISKNPHIFETDRSRPDKIRLDANLIRAKFKVSFRDAETIKMLSERKMSGKDDLMKLDLEVESDGVQKSENDKGG